MAPHIGRGAGRADGCGGVRQSSAARVLLQEMALPSWVFYSLNTGVLAVINDKCD